jgi:hypothetical protein
MTAQPRSTSRLNIISIFFNYHGEKSLRISTKGVNGLFHDGQWNLESALLTKFFFKF